MSKDKGIFEPQEGFASPPKSPFSVDDSASNPFAAPSEAPSSPFAVAGEEEATRLKPEESGESPFASGQGKSPFGFEPPAASGSPFGGESAEKAPEASSSPFGIDESAPKKEESPFGQVAEPTPTAPVEPAPEKPAAVASAPVDSGESDSSSIKQLELRAIFGVDRELTETEILQRAGSLPGIRHLGRVSAADIGAVEGIKRVLGNLNFGGGQVKLYSGSAPIDFIREGGVMLAVQTDGGFAPGVRETLMIVARELGRM